MSEHLHHAMLPREFKTRPLTGADRINRSLWGIHQDLKKIERLMTFVLERLEEIPQPSTVPDRPLKGERHRRIPEHIKRPKRVIVLGMDRIRRLRKKLNLSQEALASRLGVSGTMISHIEAGRSGISRKMDARMRRLERE